MTSLDEVINTSQDVREVKRALSVKMLQNGITPGQIHGLLNVSVQYVSKWKTQYEAYGVSSLLIAYKGKEGYLDAHQGLAKDSWKIFCMPFEPNAPEQNPIEGIWLQGKNFLRKHFALNKTFANVKQCFVNFLTSLRFDSHKFNWYFPQMI